MPQGSLYSVCLPWSAQLFAVGGNLGRYKLEMWTASVSRLLLRERSEGARRMMGGAPCPEAGSTHLERL